MGRDTVDWLRKKRQRSVTIWLVCMMTSSSVSCSLNNIQTLSEQLNIIYERNEEQSKKCFNIRQLFNLN
jgi:hypothetical protein